MTEKIKVRPVPGRLVRIPATGQRIDKPMEVESTTFIRRRLAEGDLEHDKEVK